MRRVTFSICTVLLACPAPAAELHCLGLSPGFMLVLEDSTARFDYLGDGVFSVTPPLALPLDSLTRLELAAHGGPIPVFLERAPYPMLGAELAFRVEIGIHTSEGLQPMFGCCREAD